MDAKRIGELRDYLDAAETEGFGSPPVNADNVRQLLDAYELLGFICGDAEMIPDPQMDGTTDTYSVPLDDIAQAKALLAKASD